MNSQRDATFPRNSVMSRSQPDFVLLSGTSHPDLVCLDLGCVVHLTIC